VHRPLEVQGLSGVDPEGVPPRPTFALRLNQPVRARDVVGHCAMRAPRGAVVRLTTPDPQAKASSVALVPAKTLEQDTEYLLRCERLAGAGGNAGLEQPYEVRMRTYPRLTIASIGPRGEDVAADEVPDRDRLLHAGDDR